VTHACHYYVYETYVCKSTRHSSVFAVRPPLPPPVSASPGALPAFATAVLSEGTEREKEREREKTYFATEELLDENTDAKGG
jgi:hypothetical protein